jgi:predicted AAA+ superfamily ATPase
MGGEAGRDYLTLDDQTVLDAARVDPEGFIRALDRAIIDEVQRVPELLLAIKRSVDEDYRPGRFLLTGSANVLTLPRVADSLAGRMETIHLLTLAQAEILGRRTSFLGSLFAGSLSGPDQKMIGDMLTAVVLSGGYPPLIAAVKASPSVSPRIVSMMPGRRMSKPCRP